MKLVRFAAQWAAMLLAVVLWAVVMPSGVEARQREAAGQPAPIEVGVAAVDITPNYPVRLGGFGFRREESEGVTQRIWAKALAIGSDAEGPAVVLAVDNCGVPDAMVEEVAQRLNRACGLPRERFAVTFTHTHTAPMITNVFITLFSVPIPPEHQAHIDRHTAELTDHLEQVSLAALKDRKAARLSWGVGSAAIAKNRRTPGGPVDHDLPLLAVKDLDGKLRAAWVSYACHAVTLSNNRIGGDWPGYAQEAIEKNHPGAVALVSIGCGADQNPVSGVTGDKVEIAAGQGAEIAAEVERLLAGYLAPITAPVTAKFERFDLPLDALPDRAEWERRVAQGSYIGYHAQVQLARLDRGEKLKDRIGYSVGTWTFGDQLAMVFLPGEVVVDYSLRLKRELDRSRLWINAYANDAPCYIPSERVLKEGGYEGGGAMTYYDVPGKLAAGLEEKIVSAVRKQLPETFRKPIDAGDQPGAKPLSPQQSGALLRTKPDFAVELLAAEPLVTDPVAIDFGADGRLWVAEMHDYPSGLTGDYAPGGRVRLLTDVDGDGRYDASSVFLDGIPFPTGVTAWRRGVLVCAAPDIIYAEDTDGDGAADVRRVLYSGFGTHNYQGRVNSLVYGPDNWVYGSCGLFGGEIKSFASQQPLALGDRDFRIRPDTGEIEAASGRTQQGRVRDDWGDWFGCDNSNLARHYPLDDHYLRRNPFVVPPAASVNVPGYAEPNRLHPASQSLQRFKLSGPSNHVTAACGLGAYRDELLGGEYSNNLFTCEPVNLVVHRLLLAPEGVTFKGRLAADETESEFLASTDNWFRPVQARTGPDGALYVVDMYRYVIEHPRWIPPETLATLDVRAGHSLGRIYRVYPKSRPPRPIARLDRLDAAGLVAALDTPNGPQRDLAQQMLVWNKDKHGEGARQPLMKLVRSAERPQTRLQALSTLEGLGLLDVETLLVGLADAHAGVRRQAIRMAEPRLDKSPDVLAAVLKLADDGDSQVQLQLAYSLGEANAPPAARVLARLLVEHQDDPYLYAAAISSVGRANIAAVAVAAVETLDQDETAAKVVDSLLRLAAALDEREAVGGLLKRVAAPHDGQFAAWQFSAIAGLLDALDRRKAKHADPLSPAEQKAIAEVLRQARETFAKEQIDEHPDEFTRLAAVKLLGRDREQRAEDIELLATQLVPRNSAELQAAAAAALGRIDDSQALEALLDRWNSYSPGLRSSVLDLALARPAWHEQLFERLADQRIPPGSIDASRRQALLEHSSEAVRKAAARIFAGPTDSDRKRVVREYLAAVSRDGDRARGKAAFAKRCAACHQLEGVGHVVGPDLAAVTNKSPEFLLTSIFDPNQVVDGRYQQYRAIGDDGRSYLGLLAAETAVSITLKEQEGKQHLLLRNELEELAATGKSLMPEGLEKDVTPAEMSDLLAYLQPGPTYKQFAGNAPQTVKPGIDGAIELFATNGEIYGDEIIFEPEFKNLGYWHGANDYAAWTVELDDRGRYDIYLDGACDPSSAGNAFVLETAGETLGGKIGSTGGWNQYRQTKLGTLALKKGSQRITLRPDGPPRQALVDLRGLILVAQGAPLPQKTAQPKAAATGKAAGELARELLDDKRPAKEREAIVAENPQLAAELVAAMAAGLDAASEEEQYRRIPWIWRVAIAAGRRADAAQLKSLLAVSLPGDDRPLADWQAVVIGGGVINGVSQTGRWPEEFLRESLTDDKPLIARWSRAIELSAAMADNPKVRNGTRYDALRMVAMDGWPKRGKQLEKYLAEGVNDELQMGAISGAADVRSPQAGPALAAGLGYYSAGNRNLAVDGLLRDESRIAALLDAIAAGKVTKEMLGKERIAKLRETKNSDLRKRVEKVLGP
jgi:putative membrane-bound dehydrogenase-like protein